jgi:hypothetical protein
MPFDYCEISLHSCEEQWKKNLHHNLLSEVSAYQIGLTQKQLDNIQEIVSFKPLLFLSVKKIKI